jgi:hypothetical protein
VLETGDLAMLAIVELLHNIKKHPGVILGRPSARTLHAFLSGYAYGRKDSYPEDFQFLSGFNAWVHKQYEITSTQGWAQIIEFHSANEVEEMKLFWNLLEKYLRRQTAGRKKVS